MSKDFDANEIKKRRQELVEMKKIQQGQAEAPQVDLEAEKLVPHTAKEKRQNFWYHYKWVTLGTVLVVIIAALFVWDVLNKPQYDITIMAFNHYQGLLNTEKQSETFAKFAVDTDQNGEVSVLMNSNQMYSSTSSEYAANLQTAQVSSSRLFAGMQSFEGFIFILDDATYDQIVLDPDTGEKSDVFLDLSQYTAQNPAFQGEKLYLKDIGLAEEWGFEIYGLEEVPNDLFLCLRDYTQYNKPNDMVQKQYESEKAVFESLIQAVLAGETVDTAETSSETGSSAE